MCWDAYRGGGREEGSTARTAAVPFPAACLGTERSLCSLPLKGKRNTYAWQISPKMYFSKAPDCLPSLQLQGSPRELGRGGFGVTLGDRERRWGKKGCLAFLPLLSDSQSQKGTAGESLAVSETDHPCITERETEAEQSGMVTFRSYCSERHWPWAILYALSSLEERSSGSSGLAKPAGPGMEGLPFVHSGPEG